MADIMAELRRDHANFTRLLDLLEQELATLGEGGTPDFELMLDMVDYIENYPDMIHHPREDLIFSYYLERHDEKADAVKAMMREHRDLKAMTDELNEEIDGLLHDAIVPRERLARQLREFIRVQRRHLEREEADLFPLVERRLDPGDWERIEAVLPDKDDPLFGKHVKDQYAGLYERILNAL